MMMMTVDVKPLLLLLIMYTESQKTHKLYNGIAQNYKDRFR